MFDDMTPPTYQEVTPGDVDEKLWESILNELPPLGCAECGNELAPHEVQRQPEVKGSKFAGMCDECTRLKLGLL